MEKRAIKFRAWDMKNKWMDTSFSIDADGCIYQPSRRRWDISDIAIESAYEDLVIMQFTGLTDKNGREVYESDIIVWPHLGCVGIVYYNSKEAAFFSKPKDTEDDRTESYISGEFEVIGNLYETPELLK